METTLNKPFEQLTLCLRRQDEGEKLRVLQEIPESVWPEICACARRHGVTANVFFALQPFADKLRIPQDCRERLRQAYFSTAGWNMRLYRELEKLLLVFNREQIPVMLLKGVHLAETIYGDQGLRGMCDIDIMVRDEDLPRSDDLMLSLGATPQDRLRVKSEEVAHFRYTLAGSQLHVEIHWIPMVCLEGRLATGTLWERAVDVSVGDARAKALATPDLLAHLCLHIVPHLDCPWLRMLCDLDAVIRHEGATLDWEAGIDTIQEWQAGAAAHLFLSLARDWLGAKVPDTVFDALRDDSPDSDTVDLVARQFLQSARSGDSRLPAQTVAEWWRNHRGFRAKVTGLFRKLFITRQQRARMYGATGTSWRRILYYPLRLRDLGRRHGASLWHLIKGNPAARGAAAHTCLVATAKEQLLGDAPAAHPSQIRRQS